MREWQTKKLCGLSLVVMTQGNEFLSAMGIRCDVGTPGRAERCINAISGNRSKA